MANPFWSPNATIAPFDVIIDTNGNVQRAGPAGGTTALTPPNKWGASVNLVTPDNDIVWTCMAVLAVPVPAVAALPSTPPLFLVDADGLNVTSIVNDMIAEFEALSGRTVQPAQVERIYIDLTAYRESLVREAVQYVGTQNLLAFAAYPALDFLAELVGVTRLAQTPAISVIEFDLVAVLTVPLTIPAGTPVGSSDGAVVFLTDQALTIPAGAASGTVNATCQTAGLGGNGYLAGQVNVQLAPNALIATVENTTQTNGGAAPETDDHLRARVQSAPSRFSNAGPAGAYAFFARSVDPSISDVQVVSPAPGQVTVYVLLGPVAQPAASPNALGIAGAALLAEVLAALSANDVRPLTDTVVVSAVVEVDYVITATVTLYADADPTSTQAAVNEAAALFASNLAARVQRDIVPEEIIAALGNVPGVYRVVPTLPAYTALTAGQWANCTAINLTLATAVEDS